MPWLRLDEATTLLDHDVEKARVALERGISKSWLVRPSGDPQPANDPNVLLALGRLAHSGESLARKSRVALGRIRN